MPDAKAKPRDKVIEPEKLRLAGDGVGGQSGRRREPTDVPLLDAWKVERARVLLAEQAEKNGAPAGPPSRLNGILQQDFDNELKAAKGQQSYKDFKPLVIVIHGSMKKLFEGLGYTDGPGGAKVFDWAKADGSKVVDAVGGFAEALAKKEALRDPFAEALRDLLTSRMRPAAAKGSANPVQGVVDRTAPAAKKEIIEATAAVVVGVLKLVAGVWAFLGGEPPPKPTPEQPLDEGYTKHVKPIVDGAIEIIRGIIQIVGAGPIGGPKWVRSVADSLKGRAENRGGIDRYEEEIASSVDRALALPASEQAKKYREREERRQERQKKLEATGDGKVVAGEAKKILGGLSALIENALRTWESYRNAFPDDLAGDWEVLGDPDPHLAWTVKLEKLGERRYQGKVEVTGLAPDKATRREGLGSAEVLTESRAELVEVTESADPDHPWVTVLWKPKLDAKAAKLRAQADGMLAGMSAAQPGKVDLGRVSSREMGGLLPFLGQGYAGRLVRPLSAGRVLQILTSALKTLAAIPAMLPSAWEKWAEHLVKKELAVPLAKLGEVRAVKFLQERFELSWNDGKPKVGIKVKGVAGLSAQWDLAAIIREIEGKERPAGSRSPWVPIAVAGELKVPRVPASISLCWESWNKAADKTAGKKGIEDKLDGLFNWKTSFDVYLKDLAGAIYDVLPPELTVTDANLPAMQVPLAVYLDKYTYQDGDGATVAVDLSSKVTLRATITADVFAAVLPQVRALLFAWEAGWAIGTFLRGQLLKTEWYRDFEKTTQEGLAASVFGEDPAFLRAWEHVTKPTLELYRQGLITYQELYLCQVKAPLYAWTRHRSEKGLPKEFDPRVYASLRDIFQQRLDHLLAGRKANWAGGPGVDLRAAGSVAEYATLLYLLGSDQWDRAKTLQAIDDGAQRGEIHGVRAVVLRYYVEHDQAASADEKHALWQRYRQQTEMLRDAIPRQIERVVGSEVEGKRVKVDNPSHLEARLAAGFCAATAHGHLDVATYRVRVRYLLVHQDGAKTRVLLYWDKPGEQLKVDFFHTRWGPDSKLSDEGCWNVTTGHEPHDFEAGSDANSVLHMLARWAFLERGGVRDFALYARVTGPLGVWESNGWKIGFDCLGRKTGRGSIEALAPVG